MTTPELEWEPIDLLLEQAVSGGPLGEGASDILGGVCVVSGLGTAADEGQGKQNSSRDLQVHGDPRRRSEMGRV